MYRELRNMEGALCELVEWWLLPAVVRREGTGDFLLPEPKSITDWLNPVCGPG